MMKVFGEDENGNNMPGVLLGSLFLPICLSSFLPVSAPWL